MDESHEERKTETRAETVFKQILDGQLMNAGFNRFTSNGVQVTDHFYKETYSKETWFCGRDRISVCIDFICIPMKDRLLCNVKYVSRAEEEMEFDLNGIKMSIDLTDSNETIEHKFRLNFVEKILERISAGIDDLPVAVKNIILKHLKVMELVNMSCVSVGWQTLCNDQLVWKALLRRDFKADIKHTDKSTNWKQLYIHEYSKRKAEEEERARRMNWPAVIPDMPRDPRIFPIGPILPFPGPGMFPLRPENIFRDPEPGFGDPRNARPNLWPRF